MKLFYLRLIILLLLVGCLPKIDLFNSHKVRFIIDGPVEISPGECASFKLKTVDFDDKNITVNSSQTFDMTGNLSGQFFNDSDCSQTTNTISIASGEDEKKFFYKNNYLETNLKFIGKSQIATTLFSSKTISMKPLPPVTLEWTTYPSQVQVATCSGAIVIGLKDRFGNKAPTMSDRSISITHPNLSQMIQVGYYYIIPWSNGTFYSDSNCTTETNSISITRGESSNRPGTLFYKNNSSEDSIWVASSTGLTSSTKSIDTTSPVAGATKIRVTGKSQQLVSTCSKFTVESLDSSGNVIPISSAVTTNFNLESSAQFAGTFYSDSSCTNSITQVSIAPNLTSSNFYFNPLEYGAGFLTVSNGTYADGLTLQVFHDSNSVTNKLIISGTSSPTIGQCTPYVAYLRDARNSPFPISTTTTLSFTASSKEGTTTTTGTYSDSTCGTSLSAPSITAGSHFVSFYIKRITPEAMVLSINGAGLASGTISITPALSNTASKLVFNGLPANNSLPLNTCSGPYNIVAKNQTDSLVAVSSAVTANLTKTTGTFYSDNLCTVTINSTTISNGSTTSSNFYFKHTSAATINITVSDLASILIGSFKSIAVGTTVAAKLVMTGPSTPSVGTTCHQYTISSQDLAGIAKAVTANTTITLAGSGSGIFYSDSGCTNPTTSVILNSGLSTINFWFKTNWVETLSFLASVSNFIGANYSVTPLSATPAKLAISIPYAFNANGCGFVKISILDSRFNLTSDAISRAVTLSLINPQTGSINQGVFYSDSLCTTPLALNTNTQLPPNQAETTIYLKAQTLGLNKLIITDSSTSLTGDSTFLKVINPVAQVSLTSMTTNSSETHACILKNGGVLCWGTNDQLTGVIGNSSLNAAYTPSPVKGLESGVLSISVGRHSACALLTGGTAKCWGWNLYGTLGNNSIIGSSPTPVPLLNSSGTEPLSGIIDISVGYLSACAVTTSGVWCWGKNTNSQLGDGTNTDSPLPVQVYGLTANSGATKVSVSETSACAVVMGGVQCWGDNTFGQLGNGNNNSYPIPAEAIAAGSQVTSISSNSNRVCVVKQGGAYCWGSNNNGNIGDGTKTNRNIPTLVQGFTSGVSQISTGSNSCLVTTIGAVYCWGQNYKGMLGISSGSVAQISLIPLPIPSLSYGVISLSVGNTRSCAIQDGELYCWGDNSDGGLGNGLSTGTPYPSLVQGLNSGIDWIFNQTDRSTTPCVSQNGGLKCWGGNISGQLGNGTTTNSFIPVAPSGMNSGIADLPNQVSGSVGVTCAIKSGGVWCWGRNDLGQLGNGTLSSSTTPTQVMGLSSDVKAIVGGSNNTCALKTDGTVWCWGGNGTGNLIPRQITNLTNVVQISGGTAKCALLNSGIVKCWGSNLLGLLGSGSDTPNDSFTTPTTVDGIKSGVIQISSGYMNNCALFNTGEVKCWGSNSIGILGANGGEYSNRPVTVAGLEAGSGATQISVGRYHACAIVNGSLKCWGLNRFNELGIPSLRSMTSKPTSHPTFTSNVTHVSAGNHSTCVLVSGVVRCWGQYLVLGDGTDYSGAYVTAPQFITVE